MKNRKKPFTQVPLPGFGDYYQDDGKDQEPGVPLTLTLFGEGKSKIAQFVDLLKRMGLARAERLCRKHEIFGIKNEDQLLVDTKCGSRRNYYKRESEDGKPYYIYANHNTSTKNEYLRKLSEAMQKEHDEKSKGNTIIIPPNPNPPPKKKNFSVSFDDGVVISEKTAKETFAKAIEHIGPDRVAGLDLRVCRVPLVSRNRSNGKYASSIVEIDGGWFVITQSSTAEKIKMLNKIAQRLDIKLTIATI